MMGTSEASLPAPAMLTRSASRFGSAYDRVYTALCGRHPALRPWHFQWLATKDLYADLRANLRVLQGRALDVGCGEKPYAQWMSNTAECFGVDVGAGPNVDMIITAGKPWPLETASFDSVLCTQVMEHASDLANLLAEVNRVLVPGGTLVASVPFAYNEHGVPDDYRRFSIYGVRALFENDFDIVLLEPEGGIGSTVGTLVLNWIDASMNRSRITRLAKGVLLPLWIATSGVVNLLGWLFDKLDRTNAFYSNVFMVARKK